MNNTKECLQYQTVYQSTIRRKYSAIKSLIVNCEDFEEIIEGGRDFPVKFLNVTIEYDLREAIDKNQTFSGLAATGQDIFQVMFRLKGVLPWVDLQTLPYTI
jgi:hypothetical protein